MKGRSKLPIAHALRGCTERQTNQFSPVVCTALLRRASIGPMCKTEDDFNDFAQFVRRRLNSKSVPSLTDLFGIWSAEQADRAQCAEDLAAVKEALEAYDRGERGRPVSAARKEYRELLGMPMN